MSYSPGLFSGAGEAMALLTGVQSTLNGSPSAVDVDVPWLTLPPTISDGVSFSVPVLLRGVISATAQCRGRVGDDNDAANYKEQSGVCIYRYGTVDDLYEEVSDDEVGFWRSSAATIKVRVFDQWTSASYPGLSFDGTYTRYFAFRMGV